MVNTRQEEEISSAAQLLEARLAEGTDEIIDRFRKSLQNISSPLVSTDELWAEARGHARLVLEECRESLRGEFDAAAAANVTLALSVGLSGRGILQTIHPADTLRSSGELFQITLQYLTAAVAGLPVGQSSACLGRAVAALNHSLATCLQVSAAGYDAYLLNRVEENARNHRKRLGRDLHDHLGNSLALAHRYLDLHEQAVEQDQPAEKRDRLLGQVREALHEADGYTRGLISDLRARTGARRLADALREYAEQYQSPDVELRIEVNGDESWLPAAHVAEMFLILREFLRNALTHAAPRTVALKVDVAPHRVDCFAHDDGSGFDSSSPSGGDGSGLLSMRERTQALGGVFFLTSTPGTGTGMRMSVPLPPQPKSTEARAAS
ncbi:sensor histidine kinase [Streptomyces sp. NPDC059957]|uniref:sensor histidine kinase n=1 Tax=unclassified Streptomyces TaxID=2593676 RepID=UPI0036529C7B